MKFRYAFITAVAFVMTFIIIYPEKYIASAAQGISLYALSVLPALFPFMFLTKIMSELNFSTDLGALLDKPLKKLYRAPGVSGYVMVMSMLSGYPIGAKILSDLYENGTIDQQQAKSISSFTSTSGPLFVVGTVGVYMLGSKLAGFVILISHYLAAVINGLLYRGKSEHAPPLPPPKIESDKILSRSMLSSITSVLIVGGYIAIFNLILDLALDLKIIDAFAAILGRLNINYNLAAGWGASFIEITKGCLMIGKSGVSLKTIVPYCAFSITFGGLSVTLQSMTFLGKCKIKPSFYLLTKFTQSILACVFAAILAQILL